MANVRSLKILNNLKWRKQHGAKNKMEEERRSKIKEWTSQVRVEEESEGSREEASANLWLMDLN